MDMSPSAMEVSLDAMDVSLDEIQDVGRSGYHSIHSPSTVPDPEVHCSSEKSTKKKVDYSKDPGKGQIFQSLDEAKTYYSEYGKATGFSTMSRSTQKRKMHDATISTCVLSCVRAGKRNKYIRSPAKEVTRRITSTFKCDCKAQMRLLRINDYQWKVTKFTKEHNHKLVSPAKRMRMKVNRNFPKAAKVLVESFREENLPVGKVASIFNGDAMGFDERDCWNHLGSKKDYKIPINGDATAMLNFFKKKSTEDPQFFYAIQPDSEGRAINFFWVDGRSRLSYQYFGDVLYFDTTYKKNMYAMPFAPFTGVNHHLQSIQFGCALLLDEKEESFVWAFETWLGAMGGKAPTAMITDQDRAMSAAIERVFPDTRHRYCLWHVMKKFPEKLSHLYKKKSPFKKEMKRCLRETYRISDFEDSWKEILSKNDLTENTWLKQLYEIKEKWIPVYHLDIFYASMNTTGRSEGMNSFYKDFFNHNTTLREFAYKNDKCVSRIAQREKDEDYASEHKDRLVEDSSYLLKHAASVYTKNVFAKFKMEWDKARTDYKLHGSEINGDNTIYTYKSRKENDGREWSVEFNIKTLEGKCECKLFQFMGIACGHIIKVFQSRDIDEIPESFILKRWMQGANVYRSKYDGGLVSGHQTSQALRTTHLTKIASLLVYEAAETDEGYTFLAEKFDEIAKELKERKTLKKDSKEDGVPTPFDGSQYVIDGSQNSPSDTQSPRTVTHFPPGGSLSPPEDRQSPPEDTHSSPENTQSPPEVIKTLPSDTESLKNPNISQTKGRKKSDHRSTSRRYLGYLEKSLKKKKSGGRECKLCKVKGAGHDKRNCPQNPDRKTKTQRNQKEKCANEEDTDSMED